MHEEKTPGLLLQSISYLGKKKILKILTPTGLLTLLAKSTSLAPFCIAEWVYRKTQKEIHPLQDTTLIDPLLSLRTTYATLTAAGSIASLLLRTQLPDKPAPYALACAYLKKLPLNPSILSASFTLKLLLHEGLLSPDPDPFFTPPEWEQVLPLAFATQFSSLISLQTAPFAKIQTLFEERLTR